MTQPEDLQPKLDELYAYILGKPDGVLANPEAVEQAILPAGFVALVNSLDISSVAINQRGRPLPDLDRYQLVPITKPDADGPSYVSLMTFYPAPPRPDGRERSYKETPWLDSGRTIALLCDGDICTVSSGCVDRKNRFKVVQMQGTTKKLTSKERYNAGLYDGLDRRATLLNAWMEIGRQAGAEIITFQSAENATFKPTRFKPGEVEETDEWRRFRANYDDVADRMHFWPSKKPPHDWHKALD